MAVWRSPTAPPNLISAKLTSAISARKNYVMKFCFAITQIAKFKFRQYLISAVGGQIAKYNPRQIFHYTVLMYSGKLSRGKTLAFFTISKPSVKVFSATFCSHTHIIIRTERSAKGFSAKFSFCTETRNFSPSKVFCYMVLSRNSNYFTQKDQKKHNFLSHTNNRFHSRFWSLI